MTDLYKDQCDHRSLVVMVENLMRVVFHGPSSPVIVAWKFGEGIVSSREAVVNLPSLEADGLTNLEQPTLNHVQSDTMASAVSADPTRALQGTNRGSGPAMEESENDVGSHEQLLLYADEHYLAGKLPLGDHLGKVLHGDEEYYQRNVGTLRYHVSQLKWTGYHRLWPPDHYTSCAGSVT
ncbi:15-hydroxyprostaglandin dehydrogenase [Trichonephila clavipes]|nr:15-hydroxyprostaglandin dehydrogenase [Trichonephila clavipes]